MSANLKQGPSASVPSICSLRKRDRRRPFRSTTSSNAPLSSHYSYFFHSEDPFSQWGCHSTRPSRPDGAANTPADLLAAISAHPKWADITFASPPCFVYPKPATATESIVPSTGSAPSTTGPASNRKTSKPWNKVALAGSRNIAKNAPACVRTYA